MYTREEYIRKIINDFPFIYDKYDIKCRHSFNSFGFECDDGWLSLIYDCFKEIRDVYYEFGIYVKDIDFYVIQVKEKFGSLRIYYSYKNAAKNPHACVWDESRFPFT